MADRIIVCVERDGNGVTQKVGLSDGRRLTVDEVVADISNPAGNRYYTNWRGRTTPVLVKKHYQTGRSFPTTTPNDSTGDNLDFLPTCTT